MPDWKIRDLKGKRKREVFWRPLDTKNKLHLTEHPTETYCFVEDIEEVEEVLYTPCSRLATSTPPKMARAGRKTGPGPARFSPRMEPR